MRPFRGAPLPRSLLYIPKRPFRQSSLCAVVPHRPSRSFPFRRTFTTASQAQKQVQWPRYLRSALYVTVFTALGFLLDTSFSVMQPGSPGDLKLQAKIRESFENLDIVQRLREDPDYKEWEAYGNFSSEEKKKRLTSGSLSGARGFSSQRVFWNEKEKAATTILYIGNGVDGWPGMAHGGALATILDECMGRVALRTVPARTGVTANLNINYRRPFYSNGFCIVSAQYIPEKSNERKAMIRAEIQDEAGATCVEATALFVVPRSLTLKAIGDGF